MTSQIQKIAKSLNRLSLLPCDSASKDTNVISISKISDALISDGLSVVSVTIKPSASIVLSTWTSCDTTNLMIDNIFKGPIWE